jgi:hypothetical protein
MISVPAGVRVLVATKPVDFRRGADSLAALAKEELQRDPFSGTIFVETGNFAGVKRRAGGAAWGGTSKAREDRAFETRLAIGLGVRR